MSTATENATTTYIYRIGTIHTPSARRGANGAMIEASVYVKAQVTMKRHNASESRICLSMTGVEGPMRNGDAHGSCGQIEMHYQTAEQRAAITPALGWTPEMIARLFDLWSEWHLNDTRAGCAHQRAAWDVSEQLTLRPLTWGDRYHDARRQAEAGKMSAGEYALYQPRALAVNALTISDKRPKHPSLWGPKGAALLTDGWVREDKPETKAAGWVYPSEHPRGLLMRPCGTCGYRYGSAWLYEPLPDAVLAELASFPLADFQPAWI